jgi:hypothetical protein
MVCPNSDFSDFLKLYKGHKPTPFDHHICSELDAFYIAPISNNRDADNLTRSNWLFGSAKILMASQHEETANHCFGHWACGWYELLLIHPDDTEALKVASAMAADLEQYPILNEEHLSELEWEAAADYWEGCSVSDRVEILQRFGGSIFQARRDTLPNDPTGAILQYLAE